MSCPHGYPSPGSCLDCMEDDGVGAEPVRPEALEGPAVRAKWHSECPLCDGSVVFGDMIHLTTRERWVCKGCANDLPRAATR